MAAPVIPSAGNRMAVDQQMVRDLPRIGDQIRPKGDHPYCRAAHNAH